MVSFICNACGQTVRKNQVEKHYSTVCRQCEVLSCIDCGKDFHGDDYASHTSCISEAEKYQGKLFQPKDKANKGEQKQQEWIKQLQEVSSSDIDPSIKRHLKTLKQYSNIPRKKAKFQNFCKNSVKIYDQPTLDKLWDAFSGTKEGANTNEAKNTTEQTTENNNNNNDDEQQKEMSEDSNGKPENDKISKDKKEKRKRKKEAEENASKSKKSKHDKAVDEDKQHNKKSKKKRKQDENHNDQDASAEVVSKEENGHAEECTEKSKQRGNDKFNWGSIIKQVLRKSPDNELPVKRLRKKVIAEFLSRGGDGRTYSDNELKQLFFTKLQKNPKVKVRKEVAKLCK